MSWWWNNYFRRPCARGTVGAWRADEVRNVLPPSEIWRGANSFCFFAHDGGLPEMAKQWHESSRIVLLFVWGFLWLSRYWSVLDH